VVKMEVRQHHIEFADSLKVSRVRQKSARTGPRVQQQRATVLLAYQKAGSLTDAGRSTTATTENDSTHTHQATRRRCDWSDLAG
jgi:hypothetical protein